MRPHRSLSLAIIAGLFASSLAFTFTAPAFAQSPAGPVSAFAEPLPVDRGSAAVWQSLKKLQTRASMMMVVAHPDDEDGGMLTYESRRQGVDTTLLTLTRGEGGQNEMSSDYWDRLGIVRTQELLSAGNAYGVHQYWTRVADFGFSKTIEETLKNWGHDRVLYDCVRVVRMTRPLVVTSVFAGNVSDGHGHHQVSGLMAQEVYTAAGDPNVFPDQIKEGLQPWSPLKVYARVPFAKITEKGIYDYATGHWEPVRFRNYVNGTWIEGVPSTTLEVPVGEYSPLLARSYLALAREGLSQQKSQNGGVGAPVKQPTSSSYHLYASRVSETLPEHESDFFEGIDTSLAGIAEYAPSGDQKEWRDRLNELSSTVQQATATFDAIDPTKSAPALAKGLEQTKKLMANVAASRLPQSAKYNMQHELEIKRTQFNDALGQALGVSLLAIASNQNDATSSGPMGGTSNKVSGFQSVVPGQTFSVNVHIANQGSQPITIVKSRVMSQAGTDWTITPKGSIEGLLKAGDARSAKELATVPADAELTRAYFSRPTVEQPYYDLLDPRYSSLSTIPYPLSAEVLYSYAGVEATIAGVVQTVHRVTGLGPVPEPLLVAPAISLTVSPEAGIVPTSSNTVELQVTVHNNEQDMAKGNVRLGLPAGWTSQPEVASFAVAKNGEENIAFQITPKMIEAKPYSISVIAEIGGQQYKQGFRDVGYVGLQSYPYYRSATYRTSGVDVKVAPGLKVAYIMGTGDDVPSSLENLGIHATLLSAHDVATADLSVYDAVVLGIRTYAARPELKTSNSRLLEYAKNGGVVIVQYQTAEYDSNYGPYPLTLSSDAEKVVEEDSAVTLLAPEDPLMNWPNRITQEDFNGWVEERGHGFMRSWDPRYTAVSEMHDTAQEPQKGGLLYAHYGSGAYVYTAYAFFRQMPEGVPGSFRIMANLISLRKNSSFQVAAKNTH